MDLRRSGLPPGFPAARLGAADVDRVAALWESVGRDGTDPLDLRRLLTEVGAMVGCDYASINEIDDRHARSWSWHTGGPALAPDDHAAFAQHAHEHPVLRQVRRTGSGGPWRLSDVVDRRAWHSLPLYDVYFRPLRVEHQASFTYTEPDAEVATAVAFNRTARDFDERDVALLAAVRPLFVTLHRVGRERRRAHASLVACGQAAVRGIAVVGLAGQLEWADGLAAGALATSFGEDVRTGSALPEAMLDWLGGDRRSSSVGDPDGTLVLLRGPVVDGRILVFVEVHGGRLTALSERERQVLGLVADGLTDGQVATRLGVSPRTVGKHLENVYTKLGVDNRVSAARALLRS